MDFFSVILNGLFAKSVGALIVIGLLAGLTVIVRHRLHDKSDGEEILAEQALVHDKSDYRVFYYPDLNLTFCQKTRCILKKSF